jgi:hypothetical protein
MFRQNRTAGANVSIDVLENLPKTGWYSSAGSLSSEENKKVIRSLVDGGVYRRSKLSADDVPDGSAPLGGGLSIRYQ